MITNSARKCYISVKKLSNLPRFCNNYELIMGGASPSSTSSCNWPSFIIECTLISSSKILKKKVKIKWIKKIINSYILDNTSSIAWIKRVTWFCTHARRHICPFAI